MIDVGQADSILIEQDGHFMLIDGGNNADSSLVVNYLKKQGVKKLNYIVGTHADEDHIGGLDVVINSFDVDKIYFPKQTKTTKTFIDFVNAVKNKNMQLTVPKIGTTFTLGDATCKVLAPEDGTYESSNDYSVVIRLVYGKTSYIFMGDTSAEVESRILARSETVKSDVIKIGHHGSEYSSSLSFLKAVNPTYAVISVGKDNDYGHPTQTILNILKSLDISVYRTDMSGTIISTSDGSKVTFNKSATMYQSVTNTVF